MSANVLQFSLGMATGNFISALGAAEGKVKGFIGGLVGMGAIIAGVEKAFEKGAGLWELHERTGESTEDLYRLQKGFKAVGLQADDVRPAIFYMQRALGGVNEMGQDTSSIFHQLGLNMGRLKNTGAAAAMNTILGKIGQLNKNDAVKASASIFGRQEAGNMLVAARSMTEFQKAVRDSGPEAAVFAKIAKTFHEIEILATSVKDKFGNLFVGVAEGIAPLLKQGLEWLKKMEGGLLKFGQSVGHLFAGVAEAFKEGKMTELLELSFAAGVEFLVNLVTGTLGSGDFWVGIFEQMVGGFITQWAVILKVVTNIGTLLAAAFDYAFQKLYEGIGHIPKLGKMLGLEGYKGGTFAENYANRKKEGEGGQSVLNDMMGKGIGLSVDGAGKIKDSVAGAFANSGGQAQDKLKGFFAGLVSRAPKIIKGADKGGEGDEKLDKGAKYKSESTQLEKMGFVMGGASNPLKRSEDLLSIIAKNTARGGSPGGYTEDTDHPV